ncbi:methyltransferase domain-containing protein [Candidatus Sumerlaeota bacterium]|nr:methyltransferase domain-containing protein [Candidatus Sumerlaeota bacterium]
MRILKKLANRLLGRAPEPPPLWHPSRGEDYSEFWTSMSTTKEEALIATRGKVEPEDQGLITCEYMARYIVDALEIDKTKTVLEVGCGMGIFACLVGHECGRYVGVDISPNMVERSRLFTRELGDHLEFRTLKRSDLGDFADETFDAVFFEAVLMHVAREDAFNYLCEAHRVLKPRGRVYASFHNLLNPSGFRHFLRIASSADRTGRHAVGRARFHTAPELRKYAEGAGFEIDERHSRLELVENDSKRHEARSLTIVGIKSERPDWGLDQEHPI